MYGDPVLVVLDEPNANLDDVGEAALVRTVQELKAKGRTVFLITHRPGIVAVADRLLILRNAWCRPKGRATRCWHRCERPVQLRRMLALLVL